MQGQMKLQMFTYNKLFQQYQKNDFAMVCTLYLYIYAWLHNVICNLQTLNQFKGIYCICIFIIYYSVYCNFII